MGHSQAEMRDNGAIERGLKLRLREDGMYEKRGECVQTAAYAEGCLATHSGLLPSQRAYE